MRLTLEELRAMSDERLHQHWHCGAFPFDIASGCGHCLTMHHRTYSRCSAHLELTEQISKFRWDDFRQVATGLRAHLEELYALRLFYDSLYQPAEVPAAEPAVAEAMAVNHAIR